MKGLADSHLHVADRNFGKGYGGIDECSLLLSCTARPDEWETQKRLSESDPRIFPFYGVHPWYCNEFDVDELITMISENPRCGIGEIGLDALHGNGEKQKRIFIEQMEIAWRYDRPVSIHTVRTENETLDFLKKYKGLRIMLHSFSSVNYVKPFEKLGCYFSISPRSISGPEEKSRLLVNSVPTDRLLLETDYPAFGFDMNEFLGKLSLLLSIDTDELISMTAENARRFIQ